MSAASAKRTSSRIRKRSVQASDCFASASVRTVANQLACNDDTPGCGTTFDAARSSLAGTREYLFAHGLVRDVAYSQIPRGARSDKHLRAAAWIETLRTAFHVPVGYSDHSAGITAPIVATALGAAVIEKHYTLSRDLPGPDHRFAIEPDELIAMVRAIRDAHDALGSGIKRMAPAEADLYVTARRSLFAARDMPAGIEVTADDVAVLRPGTGIEVRDLPKVVGRTTRRPIGRHEPLAWDMF